MNVAAMVWFGAFIGAFCWALWEHNERKALEDRQHIKARDAVVRGPWK